jgi:prepilin peptidase CpaA
MAHDWIASVSVALGFAGAAMLLAAGVHDVIARTVPNGLALALAIVGAASRVVDGTIGWGLIAAAAVFAFAVVCWRRGWMGGGDVKLMGAGALLVPPVLVPTFILTMSLAGSALALVYLVGRTFGRARVSSRPRGFLGRVWRVERRRFSLGGPLPYACAIAFGGIFALLHTV